MLVDDELQAWEVKETLQELEQDAEMQGCWRNYHLIGDAMRGQLVSPVRLDLSDRVAQALQHEPVYFPPRHSQTSVPGQTRTRTAVGFALAASLSAVAVVGVMQIGAQDAPDVSQVAAAQAPAAPAPVLAQQAEVQQPKYLYTFTADVTSMPPTALASSSGSMPVTLAGSSAGEAPRVHTVAVARELPNDLADYLLNYPHYAANHEQEDTLSYLRLVGYGE